MPFIGTQPDVGGYSVLDNLTASATASYTLQKDSANFSPSSANQLLVSLNGVIQKPGSSFTVSGSTLTFSSALTSNDSIDFILAMGEPLLVGTPSDGTVSTAKIATDAVTNAKIASGVSAAKVTTGVLPAAQVPAGSVVQTVAVTQTGIKTNSSTSTFTEVLETAFTPVSDSNKLFIYAQLGGCDTATGRGFGQVSYSASANQIASNTNYVLKIASEYGRGENYAAESHTGNIVSSKVINANHNSMSGTRYYGIGIKNQLSGTFRIGNGVDHELVIMEIKV